MDLASLLKQRRREEGKKQIADAAKPRFDLDVKHAAEKFATTFNFYIRAQCQKKKKKVCGEKHTSNAMRLAYEIACCLREEEKASTAVNLCFQDAANRRTTLLTAVISRR